MDRDPYAILDVPRDASPEDIKTAFRLQAKLHHPDFNEDKAHATARFKAIVEAYRVAYRAAKSRSTEKQSDVEGIDLENDPKHDWFKNGMEMPFVSGADIGRVNRKRSAGPWYHNDAILNFLIVIFIIYDICLIAAFLSGALDKPD